MSDTVLTTAADVSPELPVPPEVVPDPPKARRRNRIPRLKPWWIRTHRWVSLALGLLLLMECLSGTVLLLRPQIDVATHPERYVSTGSTTPLTGSQAIALVAQQHPELDGSSAFGFHGVWMVSGDSAATAYVDPGSGRINEIGTDPFIMGLLVQVHDCFFSCDGYPAYLPFMNASIGDTDYTVAGYLLGVIALALAFLAVSGLVIWWPALRGWATAIRVRTRRGPYARDLDLHKIIGILAMPLLLMWGLTGMTLEGWQWPSEVYYALVPGDAPASTDAPAPGTGPMIDSAAAEAAAAAAVPGGHVVGVRSYDPEKSDGSYLINVDTTSDIHRDLYDMGPTDYVTVDSHGGGVQGEAPRTGWQEFWEKTLQSMHTGAELSVVPRVLWEVTSGLSMVLLTVTGVTVWLTRWRSRRNRRAAAKRRAAQPQS